MVFADWHAERDTTRRLAKLTISGELLLGLFQRGAHPGYWIAENPLPDDVRIVKAETNHRMALVLVLESSRFAPVPEGCTIPEVAPIQVRGFMCSLAEFREEHPELFSEPTHAEA